MDRRPLLALFLILCALILGSLAAAAISPELARSELELCTYENGRFFV